MSVNATVVSGDAAIPFLRGVYNSGQDFLGGGNQWPVEDSADYHLVTKTQNAVRFGFRWELIQPTMSAALDTAFISGTETEILHITSRGGYIILDMHNYGVRNISGVDYRIGESGGTVTQAHIVDAWTRIAQQWGNRQGVIFGLMNEPNSYSDPTVYVAWANAAIAAIRATGARNKIYVNGLDWNFRQWGVGSANRTYMLTITDSINNFAFDVHVYFDTFSQGQGVGVTSDWNALLSDLTSWARSNSLKMVCGEWGAFMDPAGLAAETALLAHFEANNDVWGGYINLGGGGWWQEDFIFRIDPQYQQFTWSGTRFDFPQMQVMQAYLPGATGYNGDSVPSAFTFTDVTGATASTVYESNTITMAGLNQRAYISVTTGQYSVNGATYRSDTWSVKNGDTVKVRVTSSSSAATGVSATLTVGGVSDTYTVTTS